MARGGHGLRSRLLRTGRKTFWFSGVQTRTTLAASGNSVIITSLNAAALAVRPFTIVRTRGFISIGSDQTGAQEEQQASYGQVVVSDEAVAVGVTAVPTPDTSSGSDWYVYFAMADQFIFVTGAGFQQANLFRHVIDSKAMRKVEEGQDLIGVVQSGPSSGGVIIRNFVRTLIKLY